MDMKTTQARVSRENHLKAWWISAIVARSIIQGVDGSNPKTGKINRDALQEELCDVLALICVTSHELSMSALVMRERIEMKKEMFESWALFDPPP